MCIIGIDIATNTGYSVIRDGNLITYGMLNLPVEMNLYQRLSFFESNLTKILTENKPDYIAIEDVLLGISGAKTLAYLARLNGVALTCAYKLVRNNIQLYMPTTWKSNSFDGLTGSAKKTDVQIAVCKHFNLIQETDLNKIIEPLSKTNLQTDIYNQNIKTLTEESKKLIALLARKRYGLKTDADKKSVELKIKSNKEQIKLNKDAIKKCKDYIEKIYKDVSLEIMSNCGLTCDVSDSIGIAYCLYKQLNKNISINQTDNK